MLFVIDSKSVMTVVRDIVGPNFPRIKSLKSLKAMLGKAPSSGLATTCGMNNNAIGNGAPIIALFKKLVKAEINTK